MSCLWLLIRFDFFQSFVVLVVFKALLFLYFHVFSLWGEKRRVTFFVFKVCFFCRHQTPKKVSNAAYFFLCPSSPHCPHVLNCQLACSRYRSLPPHKWPWHGIVFIHEPFPPLHVLQLLLPSGSFCSFIMCHHFFTYIISISPPSNWTEQWTYCGNN